MTDATEPGGVLGAAGPASLAGGAGAVVAELLAAVAGALGPRLGAVVRLRAAGLRAHLLQPVGQAWEDHWCATEWPTALAAGARAAATATPGSAASSPRPPPAGRRSTCPGRPAGAAGR